MSIWTLYYDDAYEVIIDGDARIKHIILYRSRRNTVGEMREFDDLPEPLQTRILRQINEELK